MKKFKTFVFVLLLCVFGILLIAKPNIAKQNIINSLLICGNVIIPSLFPFCVCVLCLMKSGIANYSNVISPFTVKIFNMSGYSFLIFIFSMLGGYPIGAKLISSGIKEGLLTRKSGAKMLNYCVNAGPGFIISAVGCSVFENRQLGTLLFISHISASFLICFFTNLKHSEKSFTKRQNLLPLADNFTISTAESASAIINICGYIILFSAITAYIEYIELLKPLTYLLEVTLGISKTKNIYLISFLLGFSGVCIWCQIFSISKEIEIKYLPFISSRIFHGLISSVFTYFLLKIFPFELPVFSNINPTLPQKGSMGSIGIAILIMGLVFVISLAGNIKSQKTLEEFI